MKFSVDGPADWQAVAEQLVPNIVHNILLLRGNLGAGKTTFTRHLIKALGSIDEVSSPTYAIVNEYNSIHGQIFHFDLYRLKSAEEVLDIGMEDYLDNAFLCIIEWPEVFESYLEGLPHHTLTITHEAESRVADFS